MPCTSRGWTRARAGLLALVWLHPVPGAPRQLGPAEREPKPIAQAQAAGEAQASPAERIVAALPGRELRGLLEQVLALSPKLKEAQAQARAAALKAPQLRQLPEPMLGLTTFLKRPETRTGPQRLSLSLTQRFPWFGKLALEERAAIDEALAAEARLEALRLGLVTEARVAYLEIAFLDARDALLAEERRTLERYEELGRARYAAGAGLLQAVIKIHAELARIDARRLALAAERVGLAASLNALRGAPARSELAAMSLPPALPVPLRAAQASEAALAERPDLAAADLRLGAAHARVGLAAKQAVPDLSFGLVYTSVAPRSDPAGRAMPPPDDGRDVLGLVFSLSLPLWRERIAARSSEALENVTAASQARRELGLAIERDASALVDRLTLGLRQVRLLEDVLAVQAAESLRSAEAGYASGTLGALDLLDAERLHFEVQTSIARSLADHAIGWARLEAALAAPLTPQGGSSHE